MAISLDYARQRLQGRDLAAGKDPDAPQVSIIRHPDVRRMLLWMKAHVEGMRSLVYYVCTLFDRLACSEDPVERQQCDDLAELLTPVVKAYCSERGFDVCIQAIQVFGGYGYTKEYPVEQLARDCKIASLYEGTNGIQSMDLLGRKLGMKGGAIFLKLIEEIEDCIARAANMPGLEQQALRLKLTVARLSDIAAGLGKTAISPNFKVAFAFSHPFLEVVGDVVMGWMLLWRAVVAAERLNDGAKAKDIAFYEGQLKSADYFINAVIPLTNGRMDSIKSSTPAAVEISDAAFGGI